AALARQGDSGFATVAAVFAHQLGNAEVPLAAQVDGLDVAGSVLGAGQGQRNVERTVGEAEAGAEAGAVVFRCSAVLRVLTHVVLDLAVEAAQLARQEVADAVGGTHVDRAGDARVGVQDLGGTHAVG